jgi:predicted transcriptional regulator
MQSFHEWLANRAQEPPQADRLATIITSAGAAGVSLACLRKLCGLSPKVLQDVLRGLVATGQVEMLRVGGQIVHRAAG